MKEETLEETALKLYPNRESFLDRFQDIEREAFIKGYKLAKERSYSEEEVFKLLMEFSSRDTNSSSKTPHSIAKWFEQYTKTIKKGTE